MSDETESESGVKFKPGWLIIGILIGLVVGGTVGSVIGLNVGWNYMRRIAVENGHAHYTVIDADGRTKFEWNELQKSK